MLLTIPPVGFAFNARRIVFSPHFKYLAASKMFGKLPTNELSLSRMTVIASPLDLHLSLVS